MKDKIIIAEGGPAENVGSMALIENAIKIARLKFPKSEIVVLTPTLFSVQDALKKDGISGIKVMQDLFVKPNADESKFLKLFWFFQNLIWIILVRLFQLLGIDPVYISIGNKKKVLEEIKASSYIFCIGAERINDVFYKTVFLSLETLRIYQKQNKKLIHLSLTIGPLFYKSSMKKAHIVLNNSHAIFVRDTKSFQWLRKLNVNKPIVYNSYDIAVLQETNTSGSLLLNEFNIEKDYIGISFIEWAFKKVEGPVRMEGYIDAVAATADYILDKYGTQVVFIPTVVNCKGYKVDDIEACKKVISRMKNQHNVVLIDRLLTPVEMATVFAECKFSIVTRMHAAILCSGAGEKPIIAINYLYKLREYMKNIGFEDYSVDIDYVNEKDLISFVDRMYANYESNRNRLKEQSSTLKKTILHDISALES